MKINNDELFRTLRSTRPDRLPEPSSDFASRVMAEVRATPQESVSGHNLAHQGWWLAAAACLALVGAAALMRPDDSVPSTPETLAGVESMLEWSPTMALTTYAAAHDPAAAELEALRRDGQRAFEFVRKQAAVISPVVP